MSGLASGQQALPEPTSRQHPRWPLWAGVAVLTAGVIGGLVVWARSGSDQPSDRRAALEVLTRARAFADRATSVVYRQTIRVSSDGSSPSGIQPGSFTASAVFPDRGQVVDRNVGQQSIFVGNLVYMVGTGAAEAHRIEEFTSGKPVGGDTGSLFVRPQDVPAAVRAADRPVVVSHGRDQTTIEARLDPTRFVPDNIDRARMRLTVTNRGRIVRLDVMTRSVGERSSMTMEFAHWNLELTILPPAGVDPGPSIPSPPSIPSIPSVPAA